MSDTVIQIEGLWKEYRLGVIGHGTLTRDLQSWWARVRGKEDPNSKIQPMLAGQEKQIEGDRFWALRDINLEVKEGEILGIIGRNGAGKSTLLKLLSRVTAPTKGQIKIKGRIASLLEVGTGFHPELTGLENIFMNGAILGMSKQEIKNKLDEIIDFSGVEKFIDTPVKRYSSGMYVRLAFAVAAHLDPEILVIDEVLAVGDAAFQKKCISKVEEVNSSGQTVLIVSHNMHIVKRICENCVVLANGKIIYTGVSDGAVDCYINKNFGLKSSTQLEKNEYLVKNAVFISIRVVDTQGKERTSYDIRKSFVLEFLYEVLSDNFKIEAAFFFKDIYGDIIFMSTTMHEKERKTKKNKKGIYLSKCIIPGNFLAEGIFSITAILNTVDFESNPVVHDKHENAVIIEIFDDISGDSARVYHKGAYYGYVRPIFHWKTEIVSCP